MSYSWTRFGIGVVLGLVAFAIAFETTSYLYVSFLLCVISMALTHQVPKEPRDPTPVTSTSDLEEWRQFGREVVEGLRDAIVPIFAVLSAMFIWDLAVRHYPFLADILKDYGKWLIVMFFAVLWVVQVVRAFRSGRLRRLSSSS